MGGGVRGAEPLWEPPGPFLYYLKKIIKKHIYIYIYTSVDPHKYAGPLGPGAQGPFGSFGPLGSFWPWGPFGPGVLWTPWGLWTPGAPRPWGAFGPGVLWTPWVLLALG